MRKGTGNWKWKVRLHSLENSLWIGCEPALRQTTLFLLLFYLFTYLSLFTDSVIRADNIYNYRRMEQQKLIGNGVSRSDLLFIFCAITPFARRMTRNPEETAIRLCVVPAEFRTQYLPVKIHKSHSLAQLAWLNSQSAERIFLFCMGMYIAT